MHDMLVALITFLLLEPLQQDIARSLADTSAPQEVVASLVACATEHGAQIVNRALDDLWWASSSAFGVWIGFADPVTLLTEAAPECVAAIDAARPFLEPQEGASG
ncbi:MAG: hypothetical protein IBJ07_11705 [Rhizobiaceae bacterium]|nr:hypothetical protein [Rhizobiaceae bacterium]